MPKRLASPENSVDSNNEQTRRNANLLHRDTDVIPGEYMKFYNRNKKDSLRSGIPKFFENRPIVVVDDYNLENVL
jgi:hypothetical protein